MKWLRNILGVDKIQSDIKFLDFRIGQLPELIKAPPVEKMSIVDLSRHSLGMVNLSDCVPLESLSESERKSYIQKAESIYANEVFRNEIRHLIQQQLEFIGNNSSNMDEVAIGRGTLNALYLIEERFEKMHLEYVESTKQNQETEFDPHAQF